MLTIARWELLLCWAGFFYPFIFRAPWWQKRPSIVAAGPSRAGLLLEVVGIAVAFAMYRGESPGVARMVLGMTVALIGPVLAWRSVTHLGRQFRVQAGLWEDHELVRSGPYSVLRHPIYAALFAMLIATLLLFTRWSWWPVALVLYLAGTEIRVRTEDKLLASRFGAQAAEYQRVVRAYVPFIR